MAPLAACWFRGEDVDRFEPADRFITGSDLVARWSGVADLDVGAFIRAKILESRLQDLHPITGGTRAALASDPTLPPMESGLFAVSEIEAIEREDLALEQDPFVDATRSPLVFATDGYGTFPTAPPACPVIWLRTPRGLQESLFPFGVVVSLGGPRPHGTCR